MPRKKPMLGAGPRVVKARRALGAVVCCAVVLSGCFWRHYAAHMTTHAELLVAMARKAVDLVGSGRFTAESLPELTYPLERAAAFAGEARRRATDPPGSLAAFDDLVARYRNFVEVVDRTRGSGRGGDAAQALRAPLAAVEDAARVVLGALDAEHS